MTFLLEELEENETYKRFSTEEKLSFLLDVTFKVNKKITRLHIERNEIQQSILLLRE